MPTPDLRQTRILIVDDSPSSRQLLAFMLTEAGFSEPLHASNGYDALRLIDECAPGIVLCDIVMPQMDGLSFCRALRAKAAHTHLPVIMITALAGSSERAKVFSAGASDLMQQPINPQELIARIEMQLQRARALQTLDEYRRRTESEIEKARHMQTLLLPTKQKLMEVQEHYGISICSYFQPSSTISGDGWDVLPIDDTKLAFYISDFAGHGVGAAINSFRLHMLLSHYKEMYHDPEKLLQRLNSQLTQILSTENFVTFFYGVIDIQADSLSYIAAGAPMPYLLRWQSRSCEAIDTRGLPLGINAKQSYRLQTRPFAAGDSLCLYSDAIFDDSRDENWLKDLLAQTLSEALSPASQRQFMHSALSQLGILDGASFQDDLTLALFSRMP